MIFDIRVTHNDQKDPYFQTYVETVEAATAHDAISMVQRKNPGHLVQCEGSYNESRSAGDIASATGWLIVIASVFGLWVAIQYWFIVLPIAVFVIIAMIWEKFTN